MVQEARKTNLKQIVHITMFTAFALVGGYILFSTLNQVHAENYDTGNITKERLDEFYEAAAKVQLEGKDEAVRFFEKHLHGDYEGVMYVSSRLGSAPLQKETIVLTKFEYLRDTKKAYDISTFKEISNGIINYKIAKDGRSANVKDRTFISVSIPMKSPEGKTDTFSLRQFINCDKLYVLNRNGVLQEKTSTCQVEGQMNKAPAL